MRSVIPTRTSNLPSGWQAAALIGTAGLAASLAFVLSKKSSAEREHPAQGKFIEVDGVRLHYLERGDPSAPALVLLHGNGLFAQDFDLSGLLDGAAQPYRVIAFDRPGFGYSERPGDLTWTPEAQARLIYKALHQIGVEQPLIIGHSWGTLVTLAVALDYPRYVRAITLVSGYYYPSTRVDAALAAAPAVPVLGHIMRYTLAPLLGRMIWPLLVKKMFGPAPVPERFQALPVWMALRPAQLGAAASESALMAPAAARLSRRYGELTLPVAVIAGRGDRIANVRHHAVRFHQDVPHSELIVEDGVGHMPHYANPGVIMDAVGRLEAGLKPGAPTPAYAPATAPAGASLH